MAIDALRARCRATRYIVRGLTGRSQLLCRPRKCQFYIHFSVVFAAPLPAAIWISRRCMTDGPYLTRLFGLRVFGARGQKNITEKATTKSKRSKKNPDVTPRIQTERKQWVDDVRVYSRGPTDCIIRSNVYNLFFRLTFDRAVNVTKFHWAVLLWLATVSRRFTPRAVSSSVFNLNSNTFSFRLKDEFEKQ